MNPNKRRVMESSVGGALLVFLTICAWWYGLSIAKPVQAEAAGCPVGRSCVYIPLVERPAAVPIDLSISGVEVTQGVQDLNNSVPLVAGRKTVMRIYGRVSGAEQPAKDVRVVVTATQAGTSLASSPAALTTTVPLANDRANYASTINLDLPTSWAAGPVELTIRLDPNNELPETNEGNNLYILRLNFQAVPALRVKVVPIQYTHRPTGFTYPAPADTAANRDKFSTWINKLYPIHQLNVSWHAPYAFNGDLRTQTDFTRLLEEIATLKSTENASEEEVYYGFVPTTSGSTFWFTGGIAGIGYIDWRVAVGLNSSNASLIAAHEIGHNLGMWHAPCGGASGVDANFPYKDGSIGQYGLDVYATTPTLYTPSGNKDLMSYCSPKWISDYTYKTLFTSQRAIANTISTSMMAPGAADSQRRGLLVRAQISPEGAALLPAYVVHGQLVDPTKPGAYTVQVLDEHGRVMAEVPARGFSIDDSGSGPSRGSLYALVPLPEGPADMLRLMRNGQVLSEQPVLDVGPDAARRVTVEHSSAGIRVRWNGPDRPALVRYSTDDGQNWITLGIDVTGGELLIDPSALPAPDGIFEVLLSGK